MRLRRSIHALSCALPLMFGPALLGQPPVHNEPDPPDEAIAAYEKGGEAQAAKGAADWEKFLLLEDCHANFINPLSIAKYTAGNVIYDIAQGHVNDGNFALQDARWDDATEAFEKAIDKFHEAANVWASVELPPIAQQARRRARPRGYQDLLDKLTAMGYGQQVRKLQRAKPR